MNYNVWLIEPETESDPEGGALIEWYATNNEMRARECVERLEACGLMVLWDAAVQRSP